jgi:haloalkane dehalogenase
MKSNELRYRSEDVLGSSISYRSAGTGEPTVLFLHGNPTSSYIWRNVIPHVLPRARCIAPDLIGFGRSGKPDIEYRFTDHARYLDAFIEALGLKRLILVAQDWGTALAFHYARRHAGNVLGMAFMEFIRPYPNWDAFHQRPEARELFKAIRTAGTGERMVLDENVFVERVLPKSVLRPLTEEEMNAYRAPFPTPKSRRPILSLPRELPVAGEPADVDHLLELAHTALQASHYPKLLFYGEPGALISPAAAREYAGRLHNCRLVNLGPGAHYLQEDHPEKIGRELAEWVDQIKDTTRSASDGRIAEGGGSTLRC